jgi:hypothetical protein
VDTFTYRPLYHPEKSPQYPLNRGFGRYRARLKATASLGTETTTPCCSTGRLVTASASMLLVCSSESYTHWADLRRAAEVSRCARHAIAPLYYRHVDKAIKTCWGVPVCTPHSSLCLLHIDRATKTCWHMPVCTPHSRLSVYYRRIYRATKSSTNAQLQVEAVRYRFHLTGCPALLCTGSTCYAAARETSI